MVENDARISVMHLVEASGGGDVMYGKERVIHWLMRAQRGAGDVATRLAVFAPCVLATTAQSEGFDVHVLGDAERTIPVGALRALRIALAAAGAPILHTHGYKANIIGRTMRLGGAPMAALVATCHGYVVYQPNLRFYNAFDRATGWLSDVVTAPDPGMLRWFPPGVRTRFVPNAIPETPLPDATARARARASFGWTDDAFVAGMLGRFSVEKGVTNFVEAARLAGDSPVRWAAAGTGPLEADVRASAPPSLKCLGFLSPADDFLTAIDVYVQPSFTEGLSLSLLEAMRFGLPIVATKVGATAEALRDGIDALLVAPDPSAILEGVMRFRSDAALRARMGASARTRFQDGFRMEVIERKYADLYRFAVGRKGERR
jgi:glycosyltransferase involved in cell wall biosynthesis